MPKIIIGIPGLSDNLDQHEGIEDPFGGPLMMPASPDIECY